jgi:hypothetical protein
MGIVLRRTLGVAWLLLALVSAAQGQPTDVRLAVEPSGVGIGGVVRPGDWTPMLITLENVATLPRQVRCAWVTADADGDQVRWSRNITLTPQRKQRAWLYAAVPVDVTSKTQWRVEVVDAQSNQLLASQALSLTQPASRVESFIGVTSTLGLGLDPYTQEVTQHEAVRVIRGLDPASLPDRWQGFHSLAALVWTPDAADPASPGISPQTHQALRAWVRRGGHLVIVMPAVGETWSRSPLADLLPTGRIQRLPASDAPAWLGSVSGGERLPQLDLTTFEPGPDVSVLLRQTSGEGRPVVVARQIGFGRVTVVGVDLTDRQLVIGRMPNGSTFWNTLFTWRSPAVPLNVVNDNVSRRDYSDSAYRPSPIELGGFIPDMIAMTQTAATALLAAILLFALYWLVAGPLPMAVLKRQKKVEHTWLVFLTIVLFFSVIAWTAALALRPGQTRISHVSVLDLDGAAQTARVQSWLSLFLPTHGSVDVAINAADPDENDNLLWSTGLQGRSLPDQASYLDTQRYEVTAARPHEAAMPFRATARQLELNFTSSIAYLDEMLEPSYVPPQVVFEPRGDAYTARVSHNLPGPLRDVIVVYCQGNGKVKAWRHANKNWEPGKVLPVDPDQGMDLLITTPSLAHQDNASYLGQLRAILRPGAELTSNPAGAVLASNRRIPLAEMLSFYNALPPPDYNFDQRLQAVNYHRTLGRTLDITHLLHLPRLILIGFMDNSELPAPLTVNGRQVPSTGWTVVRWVTPLPAAPIAADDRTAAPPTDPNSGN